MNWVHGVSITIGLMAIPYVLLAVFTQMQVPQDALKIIEMALGAAVFLGSAYWVAVDSEKTEISKYEGIIAGPPAGLAIACVLLWPLFMPTYLQKRWLIKNHRGRLKPEFHPNYRKPS